MRQRLIQPRQARTTESPPDPVVAALRPPLTHPAPSLQIHRDHTDLAELYGSSTAFLTAPQPFVIYGRKSSYIGCCSPILRPWHYCVNTHARRIIREIWRLPSREIFPARGTRGRRWPDWCARRQGLAGIVGIHRPVGRR